MYDIVKILHIAVGCVALITGLCAIFLRHKVKVHRKFGKVYFWSMAFIFVSAIYMSLVKTNIFLLCIAFFSFYSALTAYRSLKLKKLHLHQNPEKLDWFIEIIFGTVHIGFIIFAIIILLKGNSAFGIISLVFGLIGINGNLQTIKRLRKKITDKSYWLQAHIGGMVGSYIATITAFVVNNNRWIGMPEVLAWLGPTAILVPFIMMEIRKIKGKSSNS